MAVKKLVNESSEPIKPSKVALVNVLPSTTPPPVSSSTQPQVSMGFMQKIQALLFHPFRFTEYVQQERGFGQALITWLEVSVLLYLISTIFSALIRHSVASIFTLVLSLFLYPVTTFLIGVPSLLLVGLLLYGCFKLFKGNGDYKDTMRAILYAGIPGSLFSILLTVFYNSSSLSSTHPTKLLLIGLGSLCIYVYSAVIQVWFLSAVHRIGKMAAVGATILSTFVLGSFILVTAFIIAAMIGFSLSMAGGWSGLLDSISSSTQIDYVTTINQIDTQRLDASAKVSNLESKSPEDSWTSDERQQFGQFLLSLDGLHNMLSVAKVPDSYGAVNSQFMEALSGYQAANEQYRVALAANDEKAMKVAIETFARADELYVHAHQTFEALVKDPKAGMSSNQNDLQGTLKQGFSGGFMQGLTGGTKAY